MTDGEPGAPREMSARRMGVAGVLSGCPEGWGSSQGVSFLRHEHPMLGKENTPVSVEYLLWARLAHALTAGGILSLFPRDRS